MFFFFFSSRRRHTRYWRDWSSDVCSSDLIGVRLLVRYGRYIRIDQKRLKVGQYLFLQHGGKIVFFGRFVAILRTFAAFLAGVNLMSWPGFLMMNTLGGICWASLFGVVLTYSASG